MYFKYLIPLILAIVFWYIFFVIMLVYTAEANTPDWVLGKGHKSFPEIKYLVGVGVSEKSPIMATQSARTELIKTISIRINSVVTDYNSREKSISKSSIVTETDFLLEGSQVKDGWYDNRNDLYYSFVVIERDHVLETLRTTIDTIFLNIESMLKQGNDCLNNYDVITALSHYYDGYKESDKLLPYIMTYNSVIMVTNGEKYKGWYDYKLLFKEKIQDIVSKISLDKISETVDQDKINLNVRAVYKGKHIKDFPIKYYKVTQREEPDIFVKAGVDLPKFEKHFNHNLQKQLFGRLKLINVSFKATKEVTIPVAKNQKRSYKRTYPSNYPSDIGPVFHRFPTRGSSGNVWLNFNFGKGRSRGNINMNQRW